MKRSWRVYPPKQQPLKFKEGDLVLFRSKTAKVPGRWGRVKAEKESDDYRCVISFTDRSNEEKEVRLSRLLPVYRMKPEMMAIVTATTKDFRQACMSNVAPDDLVLEIGSSYGEASVALLRHCGHLIGFDVSAEAVASAKERCKEFVQQGKADFQVIDVFKESSRAATIATAAYDGRGRIGPAVICIDIGGNRDLFSVVRMVRWAEIAFQPKMIIIKSEEMAWKGTGREEFQAIRDRKMHDRGRKRKKGPPSGNATGLEVADEEEVAVANKTSNAMMKAQIHDDGTIENGERWWDNLQNSVRCPTYKHPLQAPLHTGPDGVAICRYHNYHASGCQKGNECEFRHDLCHLCRQYGHIARNCDALLCDLI